MIHTYVWNKGGQGVRSPLDRFYSRKESLRRYFAPTASSKWAVAFGQMCRKRWHRWQLWRYG